MKKLFDIYKLLIFVLFILFAYIRVKYDNNLFVNYVNIIACMTSVTVLLIQTKTYYDNSSFENSAIFFLHIINFIYFTSLLVLEIISKVASKGSVSYITPAWSDCYSILALAISFSTDGISNFIVCIFEWIDNIIFEFKKE